MREILGMARARRPEALKPPAPKSGALTVSQVPCGSCPYRCDVPSGIWMKNEYDKLPQYDGPTGGQNPHLFLCHQKDGCLCAGWLACHDPHELLALRFFARGGAGREIAREVYSYTTSVPVFTSGADARQHGLREIDNPGPRAQKMIEGLLRQREDRDE